MITKVLAFIWLVLIGTNMAEFYSQAHAYQGGLIVAGAMYFIVFLRRDLFRLIKNSDFVVMLFILIAPVILMGVSDRAFERGNYATMIAVVLVFVIAAILASKKEFNRVLVLSSFSIVAISTGLNLYELLIENNVWSTAPGRSAGFYINPTLSGEALLAFGLAFILLRSGKLLIFDYLLLLLVAAGILATFSRSAIVVGVVLFSIAILIRAGSKHIFRSLLVLSLALLSATYLTGYVISNINLSEDASNRIYSLIDNGGVGDYKEDRGNVAAASMLMALNEPVFGVGVGTVSQMDEGPHNIFVGVFVDYGAVGLAILIVLICRLAYIGFHLRSEKSRIVLAFVGWFVMCGFASHTLLGMTATMVWFGYVFSFVDGVKRRLVK